jgi:predicted nucleotidyltransferase
MNIGISVHDVELIKSALDINNVSRAMVFGSRAKGNWRKNSDIDIAVFGEAINPGKLGLALEELPMPYKIDVVLYDEIKSDALRDHIDRVGVELYNRKES